MADDVIIMLLLWIAGFLFGYDISQKKKGYDK